MYKSTVTSKGQLTIPKEVRELLDLNTGNGVIFKIDSDSKIITFEKDNEEIDCPVCKGYGSFNIGDQPCFFCDQSKKISASMSAWQLIGNIKLTYGVSVSVIHQAIDPQRELIFLDIPTVELYSKNYFVQLLDIAHDYLQMKLITDYAPRSTSDPEKFMIPSDVVLDEILGLLKRDSAKNEIKRWFRYENGIFSPTLIQSDEE